METIKKNGGIFRFKLDNQDFELKQKEDFLLSWYDLWLNEYKYY